MIVLDTNVVSELMRPSPAAAVREWLQAQDGRALFIAATTLAEIGYGIERLPDGRRKQLLRTTAEEVFAAFESQVLAFDAAAAGRYADVVSRCETAGLPIDGFDAQIAAICLVHGAALATRNLRDFRGTGVELVDPWAAA